MGWHEHVRGARVLVAIPDAELQGTVVRLLRSAGARVQTTRQSLCAGPSGLRLRDAARGWLARRAHDALIVAAPDPDCDPTVVVRALREAANAQTDPWHPFLLVIGQPAHGPDSAAVLEAGADEFISLPLAPAELLVRLGRGLGAPWGATAAAASQRLEFAHLLVHDMRSPVLTIRLNAAALASRVTGRARRLIENIVTSSDVISERLDEVLEVARDRHLTGPLDPRPEPVDIVQLVREALDRLARHDTCLPGNEAPLSLTIDADGIDRSMTWRIDPRLFRRVLDNLLHNALTHGRRAPIRVQVATAGDRLELQVADGGPGIPAAIRDRVLRPYEQGEDSAGGFGLGLALCVRVVEAHGGRLWIDTSTEGGASVHIQIPAARRNR